MASKYAGTKTEQNLKDAFSGESQARNKYTYYASAAKKQVMSRCPLYTWRPQTRKRACQDVVQRAARHRNS